MADIYLWLVILLFGLAITDLVVGVSNDAVNFLNSAIGSKVAKRSFILIVASLGVFIGATFSSGMMEIARKGIFNPELFYFSDVMVIFLAVMLTDIILLDLFNTFGMPTSTTVSIVFELLGASVVVALYKILSATNEAHSLFDYINTDKAVAIIVGIFLSVFIAFNAGVIIQYISRALFSFNFQKRMKYVAGVWTGLSLTALSYFLVFKGMKGASFVSVDTISWITSNLTLLLLGSAVFWIAVMQILVMFKVNVLKIVVLFGTFSLAMAFAGNDLVNFIGVPVAAFESFTAWKASGVAPDALLMVSLSEPVKTKTYLLLIAGLVMVVTLWFSKKAKTVTETEVNLGRQDEGEERFSPNMVARVIVKGTIKVAESVTYLIPVQFMNRLESNFKKNDIAVSISDDEKPAFDLVRASVNLTMASLLISLATSLKLPLSTTYVSFMVAMGSSLADKAWDRESAVYRVAGVVNVIGGWLLTALVAFSVAGLFAVVILAFDVWGVLSIVLVATTAIARSFLHHKSSEKKKEDTKKSEPLQVIVQQKELKQGILLLVNRHIGLTTSSLQISIQSLLDENEKQIRKSQAVVDQMKAEEQSILGGGLSILHGTSIEFLQTRQFVHTISYLQDLSQSCGLIAENIEVHVMNGHKPLSKDQKNILVDLEAAMTEFLNEVNCQVAGKEITIEASQNKLEKAIEQGMKLQFKLLKQNAVSKKNNTLMFRILLESRDVISVCNNLLKEFSTDTEALEELV